MLKKSLIGFLISLAILFSIASSAYCNLKSTQTFVGPTRGSISSLFGWRSDPFNGKTAFHCGMDIATAESAPIYALQEGYVTFSGLKGGYGKTVTINHQYPDIPELPAVETMYAHNSKIMVNVGQYVRRGDIIALAGSTGRSTGPHLHFEVHYNGGYVDPIDYLTKLPKYLTYARYKRNKYYAYKTMTTPQIKPQISAQEKSNYIMIED